MPAEEAVLSSPNVPSPAPGRTLPRALAHALARHSTHAFGLMGNGNAHFIDELPAAGISLTQVRHEAATVASADAYTRISGRLAIATATYGAGFTNTLTALAEAAQARTPMLVVVGDAPTTGARPWDVDQEMLAAAMGVRTITLALDDLDATVDRAVASAQRSRRPIVLAIPYDLVTAEIIEPEPLGIDLNDPEVIRSLAAATLPAAARAATRGEPRPRTAATPAELAEALTALGRAERPLVLAGRGAWISGAGPELDALAERLGAPTASTALARGIFSDARYDLGVTGGFGQESAMAVIAEADVVVAVGASLNQFTMRFGELLGAETTLIRVDSDQVAPPRTVHPVKQVLLRGDAKEVLRMLLAELPGRRASGADWRERLTGLEPGGALRRRADGLAEHPDGRCADGRLDPRAVAARLAELLPEDRHVTSDGGHFIGWANMFWPVDSPERMIMVGTAYQTIGLGLATVAGVAAAAPDSTVVVTTGDGGALMSLADLETAVRTAGSCVIVVWNDAAYGAEVHLYGAMGLAEPPMLIPETDFAALARSFGATGVRVDSLADLDALREWSASGARGTILLDCRVSRSVVAPYQREVQRANGLEV